MTTVAEVLELYATLGLLNAETIDFVDSLTKRRRGVVKRRLLKRVREQEARAWIDRQCSAPPSSETRRVMANM